MALTLGAGPLAPRRSAEVNYRLDGPKHLLLFESFPRRIRATLGGETVLDTERGKLLYETAIPPVLYFPLEDLVGGSPEPSERSTHCPFKGDASYWTLRAGDRVAENAVWGYPEPTEAAAWLKGYASLYPDAMDAWFEEDEPVRFHLRDPYHRVDVLPSSRRVRVLAHGEVVAETIRPMLVFETSLPTRYYVPREDVREDVLVPSETETGCPYKGEASYWSLRAGDRTLEDAVWGYPQPLPEGAPLAGHVAFSHPELEVTLAAPR